MAAGDFSASVKQQTQIYIDNMFTSNTMVDAQFMYEPMTFEGIISNQTARQDPRLEGPDCVGQKVYFLTKTATTLVHSGTTPRTGEGCATPAGTQLESEGKNYNNNLYLEASGEIRETCNNDTTLAQLSAKLLVGMRVDLLKEANKRGITLLSSNTQANRYANFDIFTDPGGGANRLEAPKAQYTAELLSEIDLIRKNNKISDPIYFSGRNFFTDQDLDTYRRLNDNERSGNAIYNAFQTSRGKLYFDTEDLDSQITRRTTFVANQNIFCFWNNTWSPRTPIRVTSNDSRDRWVYRMADPVIRYRRNGSMVPLMYEIEYVRGCTARTHGRLLDGHTYFMRLYGGLDTAPAGDDGAGNKVYTGIMEFTAT